jgi:hypothetical protein
MTRKERIAWSAALLGLTISVYVQYVSRYAGDKNWLIYAARMLLQGKKLYVDLVDVNPPLIFWLYMLPAWLARFVPLTDSQILVMLGFVVAGSCSYAGMRLAALHPAFSGSRKKQLQFGLVLLGVFLMANPSYFADRDDLMFMLICPYLLRFMPSLADKPVPVGLRAQVGVMAGIGFCLKPHIFLIFGMLQLLYLLRDRCLRVALSTENSIIYIISAAYLAMMFVFAPEYVQVIFPMALATYSAFSSKIQGLVYFGGAALIIFAVTFVEFRPRDHSPYRRDIYYLLCTCLAFLLYAVMNNGWGYTYNPLISMLLITTSWVGWEFGYLRREAERQGVSARRYIFGACASALNLAANAAIAVFLPLFILVSYCPYQIACYAGGRSLIAVIKDVHSFGTIDVHFDQWARISDVTGIPWSTRFNLLWMIPRFLMGDADFAEKNRWILAYVADALAKDMNDKKPDIMIVENKQQFSRTRTRVDLPAYFSVFPGFRDAWSQYRFETGVGHCTASPFTDAAAREFAAGNDCDYMIYRRVF